MNFIDGLTHLTEALGFLVTAIVSLLGFFQSRRNGEVAKSNTVAVQAVAAKVDDAADRIAEVHEGVVAAAKLAETVQAHSSLLAGDASKGG